MSKDTGRRRLTPRPWSQDEDAELTRRYHDQPITQIAKAMQRTTSSVAARVHKLSLKRTDEYKAICNSGRFQKGLTPWNKGKSHPSTGRAKETQFKPGQRSNTERPIGAERTTKDGTVMRKISNTGNKYSDWRPVHELIWIEHNGPVPAGHFIVFKDRNPKNLEPSNLIAVTRSENMRRNSIGRYGAEYRSMALTLGWFNRKLRKIENENSE